MHGQLGEGEGAADVFGQVAGEVREAFFQVGDPRGAFGVEDCGAQGEVGEGGVRGDLAEGVGEVVRVGVRDEAFGYGAGTLGFEEVHEVGEFFLSAGD